MDGNYLYSFDVPLIDGIPLDACMYIGNNNFLGHHHNYSGDATYNYCLFNESGTIFKQFPNYIRSTGKNTWSTGETMMSPYQVDSALFIKEYHNDTLFQLNKGSLEPRYVFRLGRYAIPAKVRRQVFQDFMKLPYIFIPRYNTPMVGTSQYLFFSSVFGDIQPIPDGKRKVFFRGEELEVNFGHFVLGLYDCQSGITRLLDTDPISKMAGLVNDIDGGLSFWPKFYSPKGELIDIWSAEDMKNILDETYFNYRDIKDKIAHRNLKNILNNLSEEDNPIVVIAKLKR